jgi:hypothetical protein
MNQNKELTRRLELIESGYEFLLAYAAQGRNDDTGSPLRDHLSGMHAALEELSRVLDDTVGQSSAISSALIDNLNASIHLRALLTDLFLIDSAQKAAAATASSAPR